MKEKPILLNSEMVRAVLDGRKTQTRRVLKVQPDEDGLAKVIDGPWVDTSERVYRSPFGQPGDRLWVRETWAVVSHAFDDDGLMIDYVPDRPSKAVHEKPFGNGYYSGHAIYSADGGFTWGDDDGCVDGRSCWKPSIHMPRWASRITLEITGVRVERLASISDEDTRNEGYPANPAPYGGDMDPWLWFRQLWDGIYPDQSFKVNPWVWVIDFKRVEE